MDFKRQYERLHDDENREMQKRKMRLEEDQQRFHLNADRYHTMETDKLTLDKESSQMKKENTELRHDRDRFLLEINQMKDQVRVLTDNLRRDKEVMDTKTNENKVLTTEINMMKELFDNYKKQSEQRKEEQNDIISNLRMQIDETRLMIDSIHENSKKEKDKMYKKHKEQRHKDEENFTYQQK